MALEVRVFIVVNKIDMCSESCLERTLSTIEFLLKSPGCGKKKTYYYNLFKINYLNSIISVLLLKYRKYT